MRFVRSQASTWIHQRVKTTTAGQKTTIRAASTARSAPRSPGTSSPPASASNSRCSTRPAAAGSDHQVTHSVTPTA
jgi:hypothetical protein